MSANRVEINGRRHYIINGDKKRYLPSVTTILGAMTDQSGLDAWKKRVGHMRAAEISRFSANRGTVMHLMNENYMKTLVSGLEPSHRLTLAIKQTEKSIKQKYTPSEIKAARKLFYQFYTARTFDMVKQVVLQEETLYSTFAGGYAGQVDKVYINQNDELIICDYKSASKPKKEEWISGYKMQAAAYFVAFAERYKQMPNKAEIWIANDVDTAPQIFTLTREEIKEEFYKFAKLVKTYHDKFDGEVEQFISEETS